MIFVDFKIDETVVESDGHSLRTESLWNAAGLDFGDYDGFEASELQMGVLYAQQNLASLPDYYRIWESGLGVGVGDYDTTLEFLGRLYDICQDIPYALVSVRD